MLRSTLGASPRQGSPGQPKPYIKPNLPDKTTHPLHRRPGGARTDRIPPKHRTPHNPADRVDTDSHPPPQTPPKNGTSKPAPTAAPPESAPDRPNPPAPPPTRPSTAPPLDLDLGGGTAAPRRTPTGGRDPRPRPGGAPPAPRPRPPRRQINRGIPPRTPAEHHPRRDLDQAERPARPINLDRREGTAAPRRAPTRGRNRPHPRPASSTPRSRRPRGHRLTPPLEHPPKSQPRSPASAEHPRIPALTAETDQYRPPRRLSLERLPNRPPRRLPQRTPPQLSQPPMLRPLNLTQRRDRPMLTPGGKPDLSVRRNPTTHCPQPPNPRRTTRRRISHRAAGPCPGSRGGRARFRRSITAARSGIRRRCLCFWHLLYTAFRGCRLGVRSENFSRASEKEGEGGGGFPGAGQMIRLSGGSGAPR